MVSMIFGRSGTGKTRRIYSDIKRNMLEGRAGQILLVPEQYSHSTERGLAAFCGDSLSLYAEVLTFRRLSSRVFAEEGGLADTPMEDSARIILLREILSNLNDNLGPFKGFYSRAPMIKNLLTLIDELKSYRVLPDDLMDLSEGFKGEAFSDKLRDIALVLEGYDAGLKRAGENGCDAEDVLSMVSQKLENSTFFEGRSVFVDAFSGFDPGEMEIIGQIIERAHDVTITLCLDPDDIQNDTGFELFSPAKKTLRAITRLCERAGVEMEIIPLREDRKHASPALRIIERSFFDREKTVLPTPQDSEGAELYQSPDIYAESAFAAARVAELIEQNGWKCRDFAVIVRDIPAYEGAISRAFSRVGLPIFIDRTEDILLKPPVRYMLTALDCLGFGLNYENLFAHLRCGFSDLTAEETDLFENYVYKWGLRGDSFAPGKPLSLPASERDEGALLARINEIKERAVGPLYALKKLLEGRKDLAGMVAGLAAFFEAQNFEGRVALRMDRLAEARETRLAAEYSVLWEAITSVLDQCGMALGINDIDLRGFRELLALALSQKRIGVIPTALDGVRVGEPERIRGEGIKCAIIMGANEGSFPLVRLHEGIITDREREILLQNDITLAQTGQMRDFEEQFTIYQALTLPAERLIVTCPARASDGSPIAPSFIVGRIEEITGVKCAGTADAGGAPYAYSGEALFEYAMRSPDDAGALKALEGGEYEALADTARNPAAWPAGDIGGEMAQRLYGESPLLSASAVEDMAACRFANFARRGLRAEPRKKQRFEAPQVGDFVHEVMENTGRRVMELGGWKRVSPERVVSEGRRHAAEYEAAWFEKRPDTGRTRQLFKRLGRFIENMLLNMHSELSESLFEPILFELELSDKGDLPPVGIPAADGGLRLIGRVDRVDGLEQDGELYIRVVDYKTGGHPFDLTEILNGMGMQMLIYLFAIEQSGLDGKKVVPAGVLYMPGMASPTVDLPRGAGDAEIQKGREGLMRRMGLVLDDEDIIKAMEPAVSRRFIPVKAGKKGYDSFSSIASPEQMERLSAHVGRELERLGSELKGGLVRPNPYRRGQARTACDYCDYRPVCLFDEAGGDRFRALKGVDRTEFWQRICGEEGEE